MLYILVCVLIIIWLLGVFAWSLGGIIHVLIVVALILLILKVIKGDKLL